MDFFVNFTLYDPIVVFFVKSKETGISVVQMSADSDRSLRDQPLLACLFSTHVRKNFVLKSEQHIWDYLFVRWILFRLVATQKEIVSARQDCVQIFFRLEVLSLKAAEL